MLDKSAKQQRLLPNLKEVALEMGKDGRALTGLIGELSTCKLLNLKWQPTEGYDALSTNGQKFQIKTRKSWSTKNVNPSGRVARFGRKDIYEFDQGLLVELDQKFEVVQIWQMDKDKIAELEAKEKGRGLHVRTFRNYAKLLPSSDKNFENLQ